MIKKYGHNKKEHNSEKELETKKLECSLTIYNCLKAGNWEGGGSWVLSIKSRNLVFSLRTGVWPITIIGLKMGKGGGIKVISLEPILTCLLA